VDIGCRRLLYARANAPTTEASQEARQPAQKLGELVHASIHRALV